MPAKDLYHDAIVAALIAEGWTILADPYYIEYQDDRLYADLAASRPLAVQREDYKIVVEIKSFVGTSTLNNFHAALGQYIFYRDLISETAPEFDLYLATDSEAYDRVFSRPSVRLAVSRNHLNFFVVNPSKGKIDLWNPPIAT